LYEAEISCFTVRDEDRFTTPVKGVLTGEFAPRRGEMTGRLIDAMEIII
jgi:hypothetical protein